MLGLLLLAGCQAPIRPMIAPSLTPRSAARLYVSRPWKAIPEPDPFVTGVVTAFTEELILSGYDVTGTVQNPKDVQAVLTDLKQANQTVPGTVGIHLVFVEAPIVVGFGTSYTRITCTIYDRDGKVIFKADLQPPERRTLAELFLPPKRPDVAGRRWGAQVWRQTLSLVLPRRDPGMP